MEESKLSTAAKDVWIRFVARELAGEPVEFERLCAEHAPLAARLRELQAGAQDCGDGPTAAPIRTAAVDVLLQRLAASATRISRYRLEGEIARGGMGVVHRVWDEDLNRHLALKTLRLQAGSIARQALSRFVEEAQVVAQLDHPAIVPIHDIGVDAIGRPFFVMKLVRGRDLRRVFELAWSGEEGWNTTRVLGVLLRVCEAAGYAHSKGVIHRDLKPSNVMVGEFGEVYVMDWGVARVFRPGPAARESEAIARPGVATLRSTMASDDSEPHFSTSAGDVLGTAGYMSPEQARGESAHLTAQSDVYALGAMLYHLLARHAPHAGDQASSAQVLERVRSGPPPPLRAVDTRIAPDLAAICDKAMARTPKSRYADLSELADDLRAFLEGRVVRAHRSGSWTAAGKWIRRNRALASSLGALALLAVVATLATWRDHRSSLVRANFDELSRIRRLSELTLEYELLWPATRVNLASMERWLAEAERVASSLPEYRSKLEELHRRAQWNREAPRERLAQVELEARRERAHRCIDLLEEQRLELLRTGARESIDGMTLAAIEEQLARDRPVMLARDAERIPQLTWTFSEPGDQLMHDRLAEVIADVERLMRDTAGYSQIERVRRAIAYVRSESEAEPSASLELWDAAIRSIGDRAECPQYGGLEIPPQAGLVPIGRDPCSGLWEFAHLQSGEPARRGLDGCLELSESSGIVLVLLPGGFRWQGTQNETRERTNFDPFLQRVEGPLVAVLLDPVFVSKYEMTQAQWERWMGSNPSVFAPHRDEHAFLSPLQPVEAVEWSECVATLRELGLALPTEAQWEYAARGDTDTPWSSGRAMADVVRCANLNDPVHWKLAEPAQGMDGLPASDGFAGTAPVGSFAPNAFGLFDVHGNVSEWCGDAGPIDFGTPRWVGTGARATQRVDEGARVARGGSFGNEPIDARCGARLIVGTNWRSAGVGLRPVRALIR